MEVRVWQDVGDEREIHVSARPASGSWRTLGTIPLPLDDGFSSTGRYRYGDIALDVPLASQASPATVEVRVWQDVGDSARIDVSARPAGGDWDVLGTIRLLLDDGLSSTGRFQYGDIALDVPLPAAAVTTQAGQAGVRGTGTGPGTGRSSAGSPTGSIRGWSSIVTEASSWRMWPTMRSGGSSPTAR